MAHHSDDVVKRKKTVALDFGVNVLAHGAAGQQFHQFHVIPNDKKA